MNEIIKSLYSNAELIIFDSDGVLVEEGKALPAAVSIVNISKNLGKEVVIFTNNSTTHPSEFHKRLTRQGFQIEHIITSGMLAVEYCKREGIEQVFVIGEKGLVKLLEDNNIKIMGDQAKAVVVGMDRTLTYEKLAIATRIIRQGGRFIATNPDKSFPTSRGLEPGAGSMIAAIEASTDRRPEIVLGKPASWGYDFITKKYNVASENALMIGDRYETDILGAINAGIPGLVVGTGVASTRINPGKFENYPEVPVITNFIALINLLGY
ncbi:MAG: HAD-IIA family hydrolase [Candidatus Kariarchaeaceae archaeon]|jgi:NagD protein